MKQLLVFATLLAACGTSGGGRSTMASESRAGLAAEAPGYVGPAAGGDIARSPAPPVDRPGLGTTWGEQVEAPISFSPFVRASTSPWAEVALHYNDAEGVAAHAA